MRASPELRLSLQHDPDGAAPPADRHQLRRWVAAALERPAELTLRFVGTREGRVLNRTWRGQDHATNVLTFAYDDPPPPGRRTRAAAAHAGPLRADIVVCLPVLVREARAQRKALRDHLAHLVVHGVLHAQGYDHMTDGDAHRMEAREVEVLARFRIADPYRPGATPPPTSRRTVRPARA